MLPNVVLIEDDDKLCASMIKILEEMGYGVFPTDSPSAGIKLLDERRASVCITDLSLPGMNGLEVIKEIRRRNLCVTCILLTGYGSIQSSMEAQSLGAEYLEKPLNPRKLQSILTNIQKQEALIPPDSSHILAPQGSPWGIIGASPAIQRLREQIRAAAPMESSILILGESGTGKELVARALHMNSLRSSGQLVSLNCAAIPRELVESELFGVEKGAFSGATERRKGRLEEAHRGTLFLDEVSELDDRSQAKLLRALEFKSFEHVGGRRTIRSDFRLICATNTDLSQEIANGRLRRDLYYRIRVVTLQLPALRERGDDILLLAEQFLNEMTFRCHKTIQGLSPQAKERLLTHRWPGNVRELKNVIEEAVVLCPGSCIQGEDLHLDESLPPGLPETPSPRGGVLPPSTLDEVERTAVIAALEYCRGKKKEACHVLAISRTRMDRLIKRHGITGPLLSSDPQEVAPPLDKEAPPVGEDDLEDEGDPEPWPPQPFAKS